MGSLVSGGANILSGGAVGQGPFSGFLGTGNSLNGAFNLGQTLGTQSNASTALTGDQQANLYQQSQNAQGNVSSGYAQQQALAQALLAQSQGQGPNVGQQQLQQATDRNVQQQTGMEASAKGINPAIAQRQAAMNATTANQQAAGQAGVLGAQQQLAAQQQLGSVLGTQNQQQLEQQQLNNNLVLGNSGQAIGISEANAANNAKLVGGALSGGASVASALAAHGAHITGDQKVPVVLSPGEKVMHPDGDMSQVPGKAKVKGDSLKNDNFHTELDPGSVVVPRSKAKDSDKTKEFIKHVMKKETKSVSYADVLKAKRDYQEKLKAHKAS